MQVLSNPGKSGASILDISMSEDENIISERIKRIGGYEANVFKSGGYEKIFEFFGIDTKSFPERGFANETKKFKWKSLRFNLDVLANWKLKKTFVPIKGGSRGVAKFHCIIDSIQINGELKIGPWAISYPEQVDDNGRGMFDSVIKTIRWWNEGGKVLYPRGVHVVHVPAIMDRDKVIMAHPAFTYLDPGVTSYEGRNVPLGQCKWHRKYSIRVCSPYSDQDLEFCFDFDLHGVDADDFRTFCKYAYLMDDLVQSLSIDV
jgi:hypothetical protein